MPANLATINGRVSMAYQGDTPWHRLGRRLPSLTSATQAIDAANLNWTVEKCPVYLQDGRVVPDRFAVVRDVDRAILGTVGPDMTLLQNRDAFQVLDIACAEHGVTIESAGALGNGSRTWMLAKLPRTIEPVPGDVINGYFLLANGHDGSLAYSARLTPIRVVCQNTLALAQDDRAMVTLRHTASIDTRVSMVGKMIERLMAALIKTGEGFTKLYDRQMNLEEVAAYIDTVFPAADTPDAKVSVILRKRREAVASLVWQGNGANLAGATTSGATAWACYNAVTEYIDHVRPAESAKAPVNERMTINAIFGQGESIKVRALEAARALVAA